MITSLTQPLQTALQIVEDGPQHPDFDAAWETLALSKHSDIRLAMRMAMEETFGPYPTPTGYSDEGEPFWSIEVMSRYLGIPVEQIHATALEMQEKLGADAGVTETSKLHRVH
ncbi:MAG: hypothetical protein HQM04_12780 [Magnetococcales bacterium]|nr:hypothetical protein [Magnetococcales bacterium]MBF0115901.1 hypothetical protein [Magnetococcales bacterium]